MSKQAKNIAAQAIASAIGSFSEAVGATVASAPAKQIKVLSKGKVVGKKVAAPVVSEQIVVKASQVAKPAGQGLTFGQYFKLAQNTAAKAGKALDEDQALMGYEAGFKVREVIAAL